MVKEGLINLDFADVRSIMSEMGKAMMGTGEAAGDKRAVQAAEAAIANPLLDETSMRGARGLLISITGGNDLTLYEVDEAASRIRQEVDEEANIILGATFDSALDGVVRVSVVATGIDQEAIEQIEPVNAQPRAEPYTRPRGFSPARSARSALAQPDPAAMAEEAVAAVASFPDPIEARPETDELEQEEFIPPAPEQPVARAPRMPQIEDLPQVAQNQLRAMREAQNGLPAPETRRRSLLEKLAAFGITRHDGEAAPAANVAAPPAPVTPLQRPHVVAPGDPGRAQARPQPARSASTFDPHARAIPRPPVSEDDHLDIPAFLRRQQN
jgi:cell division protein FtsZ